MDGLGVRGPIGLRVQGRGYSLADQDLRGLELGVFWESAFPNRKFRMLTMPCKKKAEMAIWDLGLSEQASDSNGGYYRASLHSSHGPLVEAPEDQATSL